ncbi:hypothetical protein AB0O28_20665 [Microbispora sp. NPDC088329]|uniref:hypothetical protein n=1 Tax=Microbispora sp. NPDC088329 TaxID=3154869 RepID=UPI003430E263
MLGQRPGRLEAQAGVGSGHDGHPRQLAEVLSQSLAGRVVLCDLFGAQGGVLEHNVSVAVVRRHKRASLGSLATMVHLVRQQVPELGDGAQTVCLQTMIMAGALSTYCSPPPSLLAAYQEEPELALLHVDLRSALRLVVITAIMGTLPRSGDPRRTTPAPPRP